MCVLALKSVAARGFRAPDWLTELFLRFLWTLSQIHPHQTDGADCKHHIMSWASSYWKEQFRDLFLLFLIYYHPLPKDKNRCCFFFPCLCVCYQNISWSSSWIWIKLSVSNYHKHIYSWLTFGISPIQDGCQSQLILENTKITKTQ